MKTSVQVVTKALRMAGILGETRRTPNSAQSTDGLDALIALYNKLISDGVFGPIRDVLIYANYTACENQRVIDATGTYTVTLPLTVTDYDDFDCTGLSPDIRAVQDRAIVLQPGAAPKAWIFDADLNAWSDVNALELTSTAPLSGRFDNALCSLLAERLCSDSGLPVPPKVQKDAMDAIGALRRKRPVKVSAELPMLRTLGRWQHRW